MSDESFVVAAVGFVDASADDTGANMTADKAGSVAPGDACGISAESCGLRSLSG